MGDEKRQEGMKSIFCGRNPAGRMLPEVGNRLYYPHPLSALVFIFAASVCVLADPASAQEAALVNLSLNTALIYAKED